MCPLAVWLMDINEKANLFTFAVTDCTVQTQVIGREITKNYNKMVKGKGHLIQVVYATARYTVHLIHQGPQLITNKEVVLNIFRSLLRKYALEEMKADLEKLIDNLEVFPLLEIRSDLHRDRDIVQFDSQQKEWWKEQTRRAIEQ